MLIALQVSHQADLPDAKCRNWLAVGTAIVVLIGTKMRSICTKASCIGKMGD